MGSVILGDLAAQLVVQATGILDVTDIYPRLIPLTTKDSNLAIMQEFGRMMDHQRRKNGPILTLFF